MKNLEHAKMNQLISENRHLKDSNSEIAEEKRALESALAEEKQAKKKIKDDANKYADSVIHKFQKPIVWIMGLFTSVLPFVLNNIILPLQSIDSREFITNPLYTKVLLVIGIVGGAIALFSFIMNLPKIQKKIKSIIVFFYLYKNRHSDMN